MTVNVINGSLPHCKWIDLHGDGVLVDCVVLKEDAFGNIYYIEVQLLDHIDKNRITKILSNRHANDMELWDLMSNVTLNNGSNALVYFHQLVKIITADGVIMNPRANVIGTGGTSINMNSREQVTGLNMNAAVESVPKDAPATKANVAATRNKTAKNTAPKK